MQQNENIIAFRNRSRQIVLCATRVRDNSFDDSIRVFQQKKTILKNFSHFLYFPFFR